MERAEVGISFNHEIQVAHRLSRMPGKCQNIHGHSMLVSMTLHTLVDIGSHNVAELGDFGVVKETFRHYLNSTFDHKLLLNDNDEWAQDLWMDDPDIEQTTFLVTDRKKVTLPGLVRWHGDPTTESIAVFICDWAFEQYGCPVTIRIDETCTNAVTVSEGIALV